MTIHDVYCLLGMQIHPNKKDRKIWISQINYIRKVLWCLNMHGYKPISTPIHINYKLLSNMNPKNKAERLEVSRVPYVSMVRNLMYGMICTRQMWPLKK